MIRMECPNCGAKLRGPDDAVGKTTRCPQCGTAVTVPEPVYEGEVLEDAAFGASASPFTPLAEAGDPPRRPCPVCGELIVATAAKCRFCGEIFDPNLRKARRTRGLGVEDDLSPGDWVLVVLCPLIGCVIGLIGAIQGKGKGGKMIGLSILFGVLWNLIGTAIQTVANR